MSVQGKSWMKNRSVPGNKPQQQQQPHFRATRDPSRDAAVSTEPLPEMHSGKTPSVQGVMGFSPIWAGVEVWEWLRCSCACPPALQNHSNPSGTGFCQPQVGSCRDKGAKRDRRECAGLCWVLGDPGEVTVPCRQHIPRALAVQEPPQPRDAAAGVTPGAQSEPELWFLLLEQG